MLQLPACTASLHLALSYSLLIEQQGPPGCVDTTPTASLTSPAHVKAHSSLSPPLTSHLNVSAYAPNRP